MKTSGDLDQIGVRNQTDKASLFTREHNNPHDYLRHMEKFFEPLRHEPIKFLEIGVGGGESIRTWIEYFTEAKIFGVDIVQSTNPYNTVGSGVHPRYTFVQGDQSCETFWKCFLADYGKDWNAITDDGGHCANQIITTHTMLWPNVASGGLYIIEDLNVAYGAGSIFCTPGWQNHIAFLKDKVDEVNQGSIIDFIYFSKELAIIGKK